MSDIIYLNVGGIVHATFIRILTKCKKSRLYDVFKHFPERVKLPKDRDGYYFIDRDGRTFGSVLNILRIVAGIEDPVAT